MVIQCSLKSVPKYCTCHVLLPEGPDPLTIVTCAVGICEGEQIGISGLLRFDGITGAVPLQNGVPPLVTSIEPELFTINAPYLAVLQIRINEPFFSVIVYGFGYEKYHGYRHVTCPSCR